MAKVCDRFCDGCIYQGYVQGTIRCCRYLFVVGHIRPCQAGEGCTVKNTKIRSKNEMIALRKEQARERKEKENEARLVTLVCQSCGEEFQTADTRKRYCSKNCSNNGRKMAYKRYDEKRRKNEN